MNELSNDQFNQLTHKGSSEKFTRKKIFSDEEIFHLFKLFYDPTACQVKVNISSVNEALRTDSKMVEIWTSLITIKEDRSKAIVTIRDRLTLFEPP